MNDLQPGDVLRGISKFCWIKEIVGLSIHLCNPTLYNI